MGLEARITALLIRIYPEMKRMALHNTSLLNESL